MAQPTALETHAVDILKEHNAQGQLVTTYRALKGPLSIYDNTPVAMAVMVDEGNKSGTLKLWDKDEVINVNHANWSGNSADGNATSGLGCFDIQPQHFSLVTDIKVVCYGGSGFPFAVNVTEHVANSVMRERVQEFATKYPELAAQLRQSDVKIALDGTTFAQMIDTPAHFRACPAGRDAIVIEKLARR